MLLVDTNVLLDVFGNDPQWADWSIKQLRARSQVHELSINPIIYAELSLAFASVSAIDRAIGHMGLRCIELPRAALFLAGRAYAGYRRRGGTRSSVLADFFVGAHAAVLGCAILTRDARRYRHEFPRVRLITP